MGGGGGGGARVLCLPIIACIIIHFMSVLVAHAWYISRVCIQDSKDAMKPMILGSILLILGRGAVVLAC